MGVAYETDFYQWTQQQADLLRSGLLLDVDASNLAEEIESMGNSNRRALESYLRNIVMHLLKWQHQPDRRGNSWRLSVEIGRHEIAKLIKESPSLRPKVPSLMVAEYLMARKLAAHETGLPLSTFRDVCPFTVDQILTDYWPD